MEIADLIKRFIAWSWLIVAIPILFSLASWRFVNSPSYITELNFSPSFTSTGFLNLSEENKTESYLLGQTALANFIEAGFKSQTLQLNLAKASNAGINAVNAQEPFYTISNYEETALISISYTAKSELDALNFQKEGARQYILLLQSWNQEKPEVYKINIPAEGDILKLSSIFKQTPPTSLKLFPAITGVIVAFSLAILLPRPKNILILFRTLFQKNRKNKTK